MKPLPHHEVVVKVKCPRCRRFLGLITDDGSGPWLSDGCPAERSDCPMVLELAIFRPLERPTRPGNGHGSLDDAGGYQAVAIRAMEDGE